MSFLIAAHVNKGIVLESDRRTAYTNSQKCGDAVVQYIGIHTINFTEKLKNMIEYLLKHDYKIKKRMIRCQNNRVNNLGTKMQNLSYTE